MSATETLAVKDESLNVFCGVRILFHNEPGRILSVYNVLILRATRFLTGC